MKSKHLRTITTSLLLFQNCLYPLTVFAEEAPPELDTEFVQDLQNQGEQPVMQEPVSPETAANDSTEESIEVEEPVEENTEEIVEEAPVVEEVPIVEEQEAEEVPTETPTEQPTEVTEPVIPWEDPVPPVLRQSAELRKNSLPNLDKYRPDLIANGKKSYIEKTLATQINRTIMLGAAVGSKTSFTVNVPTYEKVTQDKDHGWISWIASNLTTTDDYPYDTMYYGNHSSYRGTYTLTIPSDQSVNGYQVTVTKPSISSYAASFTVTITRLASTSAKEDRLVLNGDVKLGTTAVASQYSVLDSIPIEDVSYVNALLGTITEKKEQPEFEIKNEVTVEAQRGKELSTSILKSWFSTISENSGNYDYSLSSGPAEWAPDTNGQATVAVTNKATNETKEYETKYSVVDTKAPTATLKKEIVFEARRTGALTQAELRELLIESDLQDNWSLPEKITIGLTNIGSANEPFELVGKAPSMYSNIFITLTDEAGNTSRYMKNISVVDTQAPEGKLKESLFFEKGSKEPDLRELLDGEPTDNWSLPENIKLALSFKDGKQFSELPEGAHEFTLTLTDERGNARELKGKLYIGERFEIKSEVVVEAQRSQELSRTILESWFDKRPKDTDDYEYRLTNGPKEWAPGATGEVTVAVKNKTTNHTQELTTKYTVVDTKAPTAEFERSVSFEARRTGSLSREELMSVIKEGTLQDNWSLPEKITIGLEDLQGGKFEIAGKVPSATAYVVASVLTDEAGNQQHFSPINLLIEDTTPPEGKLRDSLVYEQGSEMPDLRELLDGDPTDNWSLPENIRLELTFENGLEFSELPADDHRFTLKLIDEFGNKTELDGILTITSNAQYIDVTIPARMSFVQEDILAGIASPNYEIKNNSNRPVSVYVDAMTSLEETERLTELTLGLQNTDHEQEVVLVSNGQNLSETVELVTLTSEQNAYEFSFFGTAGDNILSETLDAPIRPSYLMQLHFKTP
ncbi:hypothetical protein F6H84_RS04740 [Enterococcus hirae]|uniref:hypothetical protein n=1 Tax=Enterococcus hirae TaxID=1354 RepID=UPI0009BF0F1B|nr:hypothetical protein [Enterococcus hirae]OQO51550.1 hypothetical protein BH734_12785 [Enterococcus hirae]